MQKTGCNVNETHIDLLGDNLHSLQLWFLKGHLIVLCYAAGKWVTRTVRNSFLNSLNSVYSFKFCKDVRSYLCAVNVQCTAKLCWSSLSTKTLLCILIVSQSSCSGSSRTVLRLDRLKCIFVDGSLTKFQFSCKGDCGCAVFIRDLAYMFICISVYEVCFWFSVVDNDWNLDFRWK